MVKDVSNNADNAEILFKRNCSMLSVCLCCSGATVSVIYGVLKEVEISHHLSYSE